MQKTIQTNTSEKQIYTAAIYVRLSKEDGDKIESDSIKNQKELIKNYIEKFPEINIKSIKVDDGFSGSNFQRPAFLEMMEDVKQGEINCIVVKDLSRFGRNLVETGRYIDRIFPLFGVRFIAINDNLDTSIENNSDRYSLPLKGMMNEFYLRDTSIKIRGVLSSKRKKGDFVGSFATYGYLKSAENKNKLIIDENVRHIINDIFIWKIEGMSGQGIANKLNNKGILSPFEYKKSIGLNFSTSFKTLTKSQWTAVAVGRILKNEIYIGTLIQGKETTPSYKVKNRIKKSKEEWDCVQNCHEPIVSLENFNIVQELLKFDTRIAPNEDKVYLFSGLILCGDCNSNMVRKTVPSGCKKYYYYVCIENKKYNNCTSHSISEKALETSILFVINNHISNIISIEKVLKKIENLKFKEFDVKKLNKQIESIKNEIDKYKKRKLSLYEDFSDELLTEKEYLILKNDFNNMEIQCEKSLDVSEKDLSDVLNNKSTKHYWIDSFKKYENITKLTRRIIVTLVEKIFIYEDNRIEIKFKYQDSFQSIVNFIENNNIKISSENKLEVM